MVCFTETPGQCSDREYQEKRRKWHVTAARAVPTRQSNENNTSRFSGHRRRNNHELEAATRFGLQGLLSCPSVRITKWTTSGALDAPKGWRVESSRFAR